MNANAPDVQQIADAVLYEGYVLYPYRRSAFKNRVGWLFGRVLPEGCRTAGAAEGPRMRTECLVLDGGGARLSVCVRFLHVCRGGEEARERSVTCEMPLDELSARPRTVPFAFPEAGQGRAVRHATTPGAASREHRSVRGLMKLSAAAVGGRAFRCAVQIENRTPLADGEADDEPAALRAAFVSTHALLSVERGEFVSLLDPPEPLREAAAACRQERLWPVLVGAPGSRTAMLAAPIILEDYPRVAPESAGDLFDGTEIDELLTLRVRTLSEQEKREIRAAGGHAALLLERSDALADDELRRMHGTLRRSTAGGPGGAAACAAGPGVDLRPGDRVRLHPRGRADAFDTLLDGRTARVESIEQDFEDRVHVAVTLDDDPGRDLGALGLPGHRFFYAPDELERL